MARIQIAVMQLGQKNDNGHLYQTPSTWTQESEDGIINTSETKKRVS